MNRENLSKHLLELLRRTSAYLPPDVEDGLKNRFGTPFFKFFRPF